MACHAQTIHIPDKGSGQSLFIYIGDLTGGGVLYGRQVLCYWLRFLFTVAFCFYTRDPKSPSAFMTAVSESLKHRRSP